MAHNNPIHIIYILIHCSVLFLARNYLRKLDLYPICVDNDSGGPIFQSTFFVRFSCVFPWRHVSLPYRESTITAHGLCAVAVDFCNKIVHFPVGTNYVQYHIHGMGRYRDYSEFRKFNPTYVRRSFSVGINTTKYKIWSTFYKVSFYVCEWRSKFGWSLLVCGAPT